jgi:23S rRNA pseudouridine1911/1915/1917 synthase
MNSKPVIRGKWLELVIGEEVIGKTVEQILKEDLFLSGRMIQRLTRQKGIFLNRKPPYLQRKGRSGDVLRVLIGDKDEGNLLPVEMPLDICYEDHEVLVINKQAGVMVHPIKQGQNNTLANGIAYYWQSKGIVGKVRPVHRLDKDTTGLILIAKNSYIHLVLDRQLREHEIHREYLAIVEGHLPEKKGTIQKSIGQDPQNPVKRKVVSGGEEAVTHYEVVEEFPAASLVRVQLETGRTHQIRVHFHSLGHPVIGDSLYGKPDSTLKRQALHAWKLEFTHPFNGEKMSFSRELPEDMEQWIQKEKSRDK